MLLRLAQRKLRDRRWGEENVVFDAYSGETHYLSALASAIFRRVSASEGVELDALCAELARPGAGDGGLEISAEDVVGAAANLQRIGLISVIDAEA